MGGALSLSDLNTTVNHEPRILDIRVGERLGMAQPLDIRRTIDGNREELERYGEIFARRAKNGGRGRPGVAYYLNEPQTILMCMMSRTERAADVRQEVIDVYMAYRRGHLFDLPPEIAEVEEQAPPERLGERFAEECARLGFDSPEAFAKMAGWRRNRLFPILTMDQCPKKSEDLWLLIGLGFDLLYIKTGDRTPPLRARALLEAWNALPPERRALLLGRE